MIQILDAKSSYALIISPCASMPSPTMKEAYEEPPWARLFIISSLRAYRSAGGIKTPGLSTKMIASSGQPEAQAPQPIHRSTFRSGTSPSPKDKALAGQRSIQMAQSVHNPESKDGSNPCGTTSAGLGCLRIGSSLAQWQPQQLQRASSL